MANCCQDADKRSPSHSHSHSDSDSNPEIQVQQIASENFINSDWNQQSVSAVMDHTASIMPINVDTSATGRRSPPWSTPWVDSDCLTLTSSIKNTPKFVQPSQLSQFQFPPKSSKPQSMIGLQISWCFCVTRGMPATASFKFQLTFNDFAPLHLEKYILQRENLKSMIPLNIFIKLAYRK